MPKHRQAFTSEQRWTVERAREVLLAQQRSGLSLHGFAQREGLSQQRLYFWKRRLAGKAMGRTPTRQQFIEVYPSVGRQVEVTVRGGRVLRVSENIEPEILQRLCDALERPSC